MIAALLLAALFVISARAQSTESPKVRSEMLVSTEWLAAHLQDADLVVLCIAGEPEFCRSHIPGAQTVPLSQILEERDGIPNELPPPEHLRQAFARAGVADRLRIVIYSDRLGLNAARAYFTLDYLGIAAHAALLDGGIERWRGQNRPESTAPPIARDANLTIRLNPAVIVDTAEVSRLMQDRSNDVLLLDARGSNEYSGSSNSEGAAAAGHIPGAKNLYWRENLISADDPRLRPAAELLNQYAALGASHGSRLITYCRTGMQSSYDYFVAKYLGFDAAMYDASFFAWSRDHLPVQRSSTSK